MNYINKNDLKINQTLFNFLNEEVLPGTKIDQEQFWKNFSHVVHELSPKNKELIDKREKIQKQIDNWLLAHPKEKFNKDKYTEFLKSISYIVKESDDFKISTTKVDDEIAIIAGPQLVVPVDNARYALNAANARWGSLYDALYGTDVIPGEKGGEFNKERGNKVVAYVRDFLDKIFTIDNGSWKNVDKI
jgi:malate synthase